MRPYFALASGLLALFLSAPSASAESGRSPYLPELTRSGLEFVGAIQVKKGDGVYEPGEWHAQVYSSALPVLIGVGDFDGDEEPSAFTTGSIMNQLATIYQDHPELKSIPGMIARALPALERFREDDLYNFYPPKMWRGVRVHQAATMSLSPIWKGFTNIPQDADTTSISYTARYFSAKLAGKSFALPASVTQSFSRFRDLHRKPHNYNRDQRMVNTGAFMTWQYDENDPRMPHFYFAEPEEGSRIPFNRNDVDCIVNLNVLRLLALTGRSNTAGRDQSCDLMGYVVSNKDYAACGMYYPNTYNFPFSATFVDKAGETCMRPYARQMVDFILRTQYSDGGWYNLENKHVNDRIHSTAFALTALARFGAKRDARVRKALALGTEFLVNHVQRSRKGFYFWPGEVFFTATALARSMVDWKSDAFTTTVVLGALLDADHVLAAQ